MKKDKYPLVISYYTKNTLYEKEVEGLIKSLNKWELEHHIEAVDDFGSWDFNCYFKPFFILEKLKEFKRPLFWVDADAIFLKKPLLFDQFDCDLSVTIPKHLPQNHPSKVISASMYINYTKAAIDLVKLWIEEEKQVIMDHKNVFSVYEQTCLRNVIFGKKIQAKIDPLPWEYWYIFDQEEKKSIDPVIVHYQASRLNKLEKDLDEVSDLKNQSDDFLKKIRGFKKSDLTSKELKNVCDFLKILKNC